MCIILWAVDKYAGKNNAWNVPIIVRYVTCRFFCISNKWSIAFRLDTYEWKFWYDIMRRITLKYV